MFFKREDGEDGGVGASLHFLEPFLRFLNYLNMNIPWLNRVDRIYIPWKPSQVEHDQGSSLNPEPTRNNLGGGAISKRN